MTSPGVELVGRDAELARLVEAVGLDATGPRPGETTVGVLLSGDAGMGKTRLLTELRDRVVAADWALVAGHCLDFGDSALPYLPFSEIVGRLTADQPHVVDEVVRGHPALARLQPGRRVLGDSGPGEEQVARSQLLDAVHALLDAAAVRRPLLVVVEDAHWADRSSRELLGFLLRRPFGHRVVVVVSYRSDDLHRRHPLRPAVAEWARIPGVERLHLEPLPDDDVRALASRLQPAGLPEARLRGIVDRADGNAFFVEELVDADDTGRAPADLTDVLLVRLDRLDDDARAVVRAASVAGRRVGHDQLAAASGLAAGLDAGLRTAVEAHVLVAETDGYVFRHALLAEAAYDDLLPGERVRLHARYAEALREGRARGTAAELARHARLAGDVETAVRAGVQAGDEARSVGGPAEAAAHYQQALELLEGRPMPDVDLVRLAVAAGQALVDAGQPERAAALLAEWFDRTDDPAEQSGLLSMRVTAMLAYEAPEDVVALARRALDLAPDEAGETRARALAGLARALASFGGDGVDDYAVPALELAQRLHLTGLADDVRMTLVALQRTGARTALRASLTDAVRTAQDAGSLWAEIRGRFFMARSYQDWGEYDEASAWFADVVRLGGETPWAPFVADARYHVANIAWMRGDWDAALVTLDVTGQDPPRLSAEIMAALRVTVLAARGADVRAELAALRTAWSLDGAIVMLTAPLMMTAAADPVRVTVIYDDAVAVLADMWLDPWFAGRLRLAVTGLARLTDLLASTPTAQRDDLLARAERFRADGVETWSHQPAEDGWGPEGQAWRLTARAEGLRLDWAAGLTAPAADELTGAWGAAADAFADLDQPGEEARVRAVLATLLRATGDAAAGRAQGDRARELAHRLGAQPVLDRLRSAGGPSERGDPAQLTPREQEIIGLVAQGRTNGEIGQQLFISTKTVSVHVSNILSKLGAASRTEAATLARRRGLLPDDGPH